MRKRATFCDVTDGVYPSTLHMIVLIVVSSTIISQLYGQGSAPYYVTEISCTANVGCCWTINTSCAVICFNYSAVICPALNISNSRLNTSYTNYSTAVLVTCNSGYAIDPYNVNNNAMVTVCSASGNWSTFPITCQPVICPALNPINAYPNTTNTSAYGDVVNMTCNNNYVIDQYRNTSLLSTCTANATWSKPAISCQPLNCSAMSVSNGSPNTTLTTVNTTVKVSCAPGYWMSTDQSTQQFWALSTCTPSLTWVPQLNNCTLVTCSIDNTTIPYSTNNGSVAPSWNKALNYPSSVLVVCDPGYTVNTANSGVSAVLITCQANASWTPSLSSISCVPVQCPPLNVSRASLSTSNTAFMTSVNITCDSGYTFDGSKSLLTVTCAANATWNPSPDVVCSLMSTDSTTLLTTVFSAVFNDTLTTTSPIVPTNATTSLTTAFSTVQTSTNTLDVSQPIVPTNATTSLTTAFSTVQTSTDTLDVSQPTNGAGSAGFHVPSSDSTSTLPSVPTGGNASQVSTTPSASQQQHVARCRTTWYNVTDTMSVGGVLYSGSTPIVNETQCALYCATIQVGCLAAQVFWRSGGVVVDCIFITDAVALSVRFPLGSTVKGMLMIMVFCNNTETTTVAPQTISSQQSLLGAGCNATWRISQNTAAIGVKSYPQCTTIESCLSQCINQVPGCVASQIVNTSAAIQCYIITDLNSAYNTFYSLNTYLYVLSVYCQPTAALTTVSPRATTINGNDAYLGTTRPYGFSDVYRCFHGVVRWTHSVADIYQDQYGIAATYTCNEGYMFKEGGKARTTYCIENNWNPPITDCVAVACDASGAVAEPSYGSTDTSMRPGQIVSGQCPSPAYRFADGTTYQSIKCTTDGEQGALTMQFSTCNANRCLPPPVVVNATVSMYPFARSVTVTCTPGHRFPDGLTIKTFKCNSDGTWSVISFCGPMFCPPWPLVTNMTITSGDVIYSSQRLVSCIAGYKLNDDNLSETVLCTATASIYSVAYWNVSGLYCIPIYCSKTPPNFPNSTTITSNFSLVHREMYAGIMQYPYLTAVGYQCLDGRKFRDGYRTKASVCVGNGYWSETNLTCLYGVCDPVPDVVHATPNTTTAINGTTVKYTCDVGYTFSGLGQSSEIQCNGIQWSSIQPACTIVRCPVLSFANANWTQPPDTVFNTTVNVTCSPGYLTGNGKTSALVTCDASGAWSPNASIVCQPVNCGVPPSLVNANPLFKSSDLTTYGGGLLFYSCIADYWFARDVTQASAICGVNGSWSVSGNYIKANWPICSPVTCMPIYYSHVTNSTNNAVGSVVEVSCPSDQVFSSNTAISNLTVTCKPTGVWSPGVSDCKDAKVVLQVLFPATEAQGSNIIAGLAIVTLAVGSFVLVAFDLTTLKGSVILFAKNVRAIYFALKD